jgi:hypothetical protein
MLDGVSLDQLAAARADSRRISTSPICTIERYRLLKIRREILN